MGSHTTAVYLLAAMSTSSTAPTVEKGERRRLVKPRPAGMRPVKHKNQLPVHHLIHVPKRIFVPPKPDGGVGSVRSFSSTPLRDIKLNDVLAGKYLAPLTMRDFEGYLVYRECSAENLYFILWLREYEKQYKRGRSSDEKPGQPLDHVNALLDRGVSAFFKPDAPLGLSIISSIPSSAPVFGAVTGVASPEVARAQWSIAVLSLLIGTLVMCIVGAVLLGVPNA